MLKTIWGAATANLSAKLATALLVVALLGTVVSLTYRARWQAERIAHAETRAAFERTVAAYRQVAIQATLDATEAARAAERKQEEITHAISADYQRRLGELRARYDRLRAQRQAHRGSAGKAGLSGVPDAAGGPDAAAAEGRLHIDDALIASQQALQLEALQMWVREQQAAAHE